MLMKSDRDEDRHYCLSIVMATYNRADTLVRTMRHLDEQDVDSERFELIIADDASPDDTAAVVERLAGEVSYDVTYLRNETNRGPGYTQNRGIERARAPLLMIMTDDVWLDRGAVRAHLDFHAAHPAREMAALGRVLQSPELDDSALMRKWDPFRFWLLEGVTELPFYMFWACNVSCKRALMNDAGLFREEKGRFGPVAFEDLEVGYRLAKQGMVLQYLPGATGYHFHKYTIDEAEARWYQRGLNYHSFRDLVPAPELTVYFHILNRHTFKEYREVLRGANPFHGSERSFSWHLFRHFVRLLLLNPLTAGPVWRNLFELAEKSPLCERLLTRQMYRAYFYYHFLRGVSDGYARMEAA